MNIVRLLVAAIVAVIAVYIGFFMIGIFAKLFWLLIIAAVAVMLFVMAFKATMRWLRKVTPATGD